MTKKVYKTKNLKAYSISLTVDFRPVEINFAGAFHFDSTAAYTTRNPKIQKALESVSAFNRDYFLFEEVDETPVEASEAPKVEEKKEKVEEKVLPKEFIDSKRFRNLVELKEALKAAGVKVEDGWNYNQTKKYAMENGYDYKISKAEN